MDEEQRQELIRIITRNLLDESVDLTFGTLVELAVNEIEIAGYRKVE